MVVLKFYNLKIYCQIFLSEFLRTHLYPEKVGMSHRDALESDSCR